MIWCDAAPNLSKIGFSMYEPHIRLKELETTGVPGKLSLACSYLVNEASTVESFLHQSLEDYRDHKEWFSIAAAQAVTLIDELISDRILFRELYIPLEQKSLHVEGREIPVGTENRYLKELHSKYSITFRISDEPEPDADHEHSKEILEYGKYAVCEATDSEGRKTSTRVLIDYESAKWHYHESICSGNALADAQNAAELAMVRKLIRL